MSASPFEEQAVGLRPALRHGHDFRRKLLPCLAGLVAVDAAHPYEQAEAGRRGARILDDDLRSVLGFHQLA